AAHFEPSKRGPCGVSTNSPLTTGFVSIASSLHGPSDLGENLQAVADQPVACVAENRGVGVLVDGHDSLRRRAADHVLARPGNTGAHVQNGAGDLSRQPNLPRP